VTLKAAGGTHKQRRDEGKQGTRTSNRVHQAQDIPPIQLSATGVEPRREHLSRISVWRKSKSETETSLWPRAYADDYSMTRTCRHSQMPDRVKSGRDLPRSPTRFRLTVHMRVPWSDSHPLRMREQSSWEGFKHEEHLWCGVVGADERICQALNPFPSAWLVNGRVWRIASFLAPSHAWMPGNVIKDQGVPDRNHSRFSGSAWQFAQTVLQCKICLEGVRRGFLTITTAKGVFSNLCCSPRWATQSA
jgi:hypothetical protein